MMLRVSDEHAGKRAKCPKCQAINLIQAGVQTSQSRSAGPDPRAGDQLEASIPSQGSAEIDSYFEKDSPASTAGAAQFNPYSSSNVSAAGGHVQPHRGAMILVLGILAFLCNFMFVPGILAWVLGRADMKAIDAGRMDREGRGLTQAGMILGIVGTVLPLLFIGLYIVFIVFVLLFAGVAAAVGAAGAIG